MLNKDLRLVDRISPQLQVKDFDTIDDIASHTSSQVSPFNMLFTKSFNLV
jgi:hypothetical protein